MTTKKLSLDDFEAVAVSELLLVKGGANGHETPSYCPPTEDCDEGGGGGANGCPKCKEANENDGTPIPRRCNGSSHFSGSIQGAWDAIWSWGNAIVTGSTANPMATLGAAGVGYMNNPQQQFNNYYNGYDASGGSLRSTSMPSRAQIIAGCN